MNLLKIFTLVATLLVSACSTTTVANRSEAVGTTQDFQSSYESVISATQTALTNQKLKITETSSGETQTTISFVKPVSAFSWGEAGRIIVRKIDDQRSQLLLTSAKNVAVNVTATSEKTFAKNIFGEVSNILAAQNTIVPESQ